jgi:nitroimidazol reductase NimA-like FMN-containing flavoprotein (pyridoxamine 5'-phosphate oxidase superfamily)
MATSTTPATTIDARFSSPGARPTEWSAADARLARTELYLLSSVRDDGRPHVTPLLGVWRDGSFYFCTGEREQKARNLRSNTQVSVTAATDSYGDGLDIVVEGTAVRVADNEQLARLADAWVQKYGEEWRFEVRNGAFHPPSDSERDDLPPPALVFEVAPTTVFGFGKGDEFSQTRWRFNRG